MASTTNSVREAEQFWAEADAAVAWRRALTPERRTRLGARDAEIDAAFDRIE